MIERFLDSRKRLAVWPSKQADKLLAVEYLASKFDAQTSYSELQVNDIIKAWHTFTDWPLLRREMVDRGLMERDTSGENYRLKKH